MRGLETEPSDCWTAETPPQQMSQDKEAQNDACEARQMEFPPRMLAGHRRVALNFNRHGE